jgi:hypothetical protein
MADLQPIKGFTALKFPRIDLDLDSARDHTFQERQKRDVRAIRCGLGGLESPREAPEKPDVADLQSSIDHLEEVSKFHPAQITALSARVSGLQLRREDTTTTAPQNDARFAEPLQLVRSALQSVTGYQIDQVLIMCVK